ncbi:hypothetical protein [Caulobacter sp. RL271]|uniref:Uncharacterized protein n=1 Tax=Caulobacter segnis TaxID=88688 RepID=A0ABY4ZWR8_9CAUL|nr:hypothetical protein [Caulobacter segnis]USQ97282.1 hypothetical protein MZV50_06985 [Caulobacter segnis]
MTEIRAKTLDDVRAYHLAEAERYLAIGANWRQSAEREATRADGRANGVRREDFEACPRVAVAIASEHAEMAGLCFPQQQAP